MTIEIRAREIQSRLSLYLNNSIVQNMIPLKDIEAIVPTMRLKRLRQGEEASITLNELFALIKVANLPIHKIFEGLV